MIVGWARTPRSPDSSCVNRAHIIPYLSGMHKGRSMVQPYLGILFHTRLAGIPTNGLVTLAVFDLVSRGAQGGPKEGGLTVTR